MRHHPNAISQLFLCRQLKIWHAMPMAFDENTEGAEPSVQTLKHPQKCRRPLRT
jgi:hypothetical protein